MQSYEELLKSAYQKLPKGGEEKERLVIPEAQIQPDGARTIIVNFVDIATTMRRGQDHFFKFLVKELATQGEIQEKRLVVIGRFPQMLIQKKIELYIKKYLTCEECGKLDTKLEKRDRFSFLKCEACGAVSSLGR